MSVDLFVGRGVNGLKVGWMTIGVNVGFLTTGFCDGICETVCIISVRVGSDEGIDELSVMSTLDVKFVGVTVGVFVIRSLVVFSFEGFGDALVKSFEFHAGFEISIVGPCDVKLGVPESVEVLVIGKCVGA